MTGLPGGEAPETGPAIDSRRPVRPKLSAVIACY